MPTDKQLFGNWKAESLGFSRRDTLSETPDDKEEEIIGDIEPILNDSEEIIDLAVNIKKE